MTMMKTLIVPGLNGSGSGHWQREWLAHDRDAEMVEQENWRAPVLADWLHTLEAAIMAAPGSVLVAHSLGCVLVAALAARPAASHVAGALLVAPADAVQLAGQRPDLAPFAMVPAARLPFPAIVVASRNDPFMRFEEARRHAGLWGAALVDLGEAGHINTESGFGDWPDGRVLAGDLRQRSAARAHRAPPPAALRRAAPLGAALR